ncbi:NADPH-dependent curcumin/dihydrocurcumin reductase [Vibrio chagasii]|uniref:NADP-dependent oxidoreductase n=1 Tax=Vibrio chagasii TaxID=170679 RepID=UPI0016422DE6|nr:NADP-dependent oxidoreductase [Vibrio chagasii]MCG9569210.1 NADP-dependent oxidoreductase [Vibrio chagasii]CAH6800998.1 NADPH-dependent curcumin/dihydrocurcumin reductase [Vibrio chagasii]CAH6808199.1 NADPH-dependent curcumin/dihydrocurcumin reductase [Vibrio chagasii]CAH6832719.1 NADPH-dependent curcumin/dihydrocurcumin reductase [Vibrio chagasii]CAH6833728.1 NADPH-dependent curcumin/dihydrocurcumin reductase [Vibrio chagasii]
MTQQDNRRIVLASRPVGAPTQDNFRLETVAAPKINDGEMLLRSVYLSLDPYMRGRMSDAKSYADPVAIDEVMVGATVCQVEASNNSNYEVGEWVLAYTGWQDYGVSNGEGLIKLGKAPTHPSYALGIMGMPGFTAYMGLLDIGQPKEGDTLVVAAATGPVGATVGQIGKLKGCRVIGVAGGQEKCQYAKEVLGFDECIDHKADDFAEQLAKACDNGIDVYFENVGGKVFDAVMPLLNTGARIPVCGLISQYNATSLPEGPDRMSSLMGTLLVKRIKMQGFIIFDDYAHRYNEFATQMTEWLSQGKMHYREHLIEGLDEAPQAFMGLLEGQNFGKLVIKTNEPK